MALQALFEPVFSGRFLRSFRISHLIIGGLLMLFHSEGIAREFIVTEADNGKQYSLTVGDTLLLLLDGNPTTGYSWRIASEESKSLQNTAQTYKSSNNAIGASGTFIFTFRAVSNGNDHLFLVYDRPWEKTTPPVMTFEISVLVTSTL